MTKRTTPATDFPDLMQFLGGYFHPDWGFEYEWGYNMRMTLYHAIHEVSKDPDAISNIVIDIEHLLALKWDENKLRKEVIYSLHCYYDPTSDEVTYREWLQWVLTSLKLTYTSPNRHELLRPN